MPKTLVVIDMQPDFAAACDPNVIANVAREILIARFNNGPIVYVEYEGCSPTFESLLDLTKGYAKRSRIKKNDDNGSSEILRCLNRRKFDNSQIRVCGVNAECCVYSTIEGLLANISACRLELVKDACGWSDGFVRDWRRFLRHPNLYLV